MLNPSLHAHYRHFITTTVESAPCRSSTSFDVRFLVSICRNRAGFTCSLLQPEYMSCQLNPGCHVPSNQVSGTLCCRTNVGFCFWHRLFRLRGLIIGSLSFNSLYPHLRKSLLPLFLNRSPPNPLEFRSIRWFGNYSWKSSPRDLLSSVIKHLQSSEDYCCSSHTTFWHLLLWRFQVQYTVDNH